jgi:hypothetical protein
MRQFIWCGKSLSWFSALSKSSSRRKRAALNSWLPSRFASVEKKFSVSCRMYCDLWPEEPKSYTHIRDKFNQVYPNRMSPFTEMWCIATSVWKRQDVSCDKMDRHGVGCFRITSSEYAKNFKGELPSLFAGRVHDYDYLSQLLMMFCARH